jgi:hypothetical protein
LEAAIVQANGVDRSFAIGVPTIKGHAMSYGTIGVTPVTPRIGAYVDGVTLANQLSNRQLRSCIRLSP